MNVYYNEAIMSEENAIKLTGNPVNADGRITTKEKLQLLISRIDALVASKPKIVSEAKKASIAVEDIRCNAGGCDKSHEIISELSKGVYFDDGLRLHLNDGLCTAVDMYQIHHRLRYAKFSLPYSKKNDDSCDVFPVAGGELGYNRESNWYTTWLNEDRWAYAEFCLKTAKELIAALEN